MRHNIYDRQPHKPTIYLSEGTCEFERSKFGKVFKVGNDISFFPFLKIDHYRPSYADYPYFWHVV